MSMRLLRCRPRAPGAGTTSGRRLLVLAVTTMGLALPACSGGLGTYFAPTAAVVGGAKITEDAVITQLKVVASQAQFSNLFQGPKSNLNRVDARPVRESDRGELAHLRDPLGAHVPRESRGAPLQRLDRVEAEEARPG